MTQLELTPWLCALLTQFELTPWLCTLVTQLEHTLWLCTLVTQLELTPWLCALVTQLELTLYWSYNLRLHCGFVHWVPSGSHSVRETKEKLYFSYYGQVVWH